MKESPHIPIIGSRIRKFHVKTKKKQENTEILTISQTFGHQLDQNAFQMKIKFQQTLEIQFNSWPAD